MKPNFLNKKYLKIFSTEHSRIDYITPIAILLIGISSIFFIYSAQIYSNGTHWKKQALFMGVGVLVYIATSSINYKLLFRNAHYVYILGVFLLLLVKTPLGAEIGGSRRWINLIFMKFQPTEAAKIGTIILAASVLSRSEIGGLRDSFKTILKVTAVFSAPIVLIFLQPDLGSTAVFPTVMFALLYVAKIKRRFFVSVFGAFSLLFVFLVFDLNGYLNYLESNNLAAHENRGGYQKTAYFPLKDYQRDRLVGFAAKDVVDPKGVGITWNLRQSLISVGSGGFDGKGWKESTQAKLGYLPPGVAHNDFIFSVLAEEAGFIGGFAVIILYFIVVANGIRIASLSRDRFGQFIAVGVSVIFFIHIFVNIGMTIGITPITGLPLPFLSYGGSFVLSCCIMQGLIQSIYRYRRDFS